MMTESDAHIDTQIRRISTGDEPQMNALLYVFGEAKTYGAHRPRPAYLRHLLVRLPQSQQKPNQLGWQPSRFKKARPEGRRHAK
jgi:hypothetical protein